MKIKEIQRLLKEEADSIAFLIGNGINLHYKNDTVSWQNLLLQLWNRYNADRYLEEIPDGVTFIEFYDALEIQNIHLEDFGNRLQKVVQEEMIQWNASEDQNLILKRIQGMNAPILTTNFDKLMSETLKLSFHKIKQAKFTDYYPWSSYYSYQELIKPSDGFGIWHLNGMIKYHRSIKLGLSQYMGNVERARKLIHKKPRNIYASQKNGIWNGSTTWLDILFNKSIFIFGLGLDETEVFIRWLLVERAKYYKKYENKRKKGWYVMKGNSNDTITEGKKFFLKSVGIELIRMNNYKEIYEEIWK